jgi:hypothetical protein
MILPFRNGEFRNGGFGCKDTTYFLPEKNRVTQYFKERFCDFPHSSKGGSQSTLTSSCSFYHSMQAFVCIKINNNQNLSKQ